MVVHWTMRDYWQGQPNTEAFYFSGGVAHWVVPDGVTEVLLKLRGGNGGGSLSDGIAAGGYVTGWLQVNPGDVLSIRVAGNGATATDRHGALGGWNGGGTGGTSSNAAVFGGAGGGGSTDVRLNGEDIADLVALAGGGGGNSGKPGQHVGGLGGGLSGEGARDYSGNIDRYCGQGGTQTTGGAAGVSWTGSPTAGSTLQGGTGADHPSRYASGGGGSGYEGGGGGGNNGDSDTGLQFGGGGGSSYVGGLDSTLAISNQRGTLNTSASRVPLPMVEVIYTAVADVYTFEINPNDGGSPEITKQMTMLQNSGPNRMNIVQEGNTTVPTLTFSGVILEQQQYENLEYWFDRRVLIEMVDDLGRTFYGVFSKFSPQRTRRPLNPWYHTYDAEFTVTAYINASGQRVYGRML